MALVSQREVTLPHQDDQATVQNIELLQALTHGLSLAEHAAPRVPVPLRTKVCRRFYEPIVLLVALNKACSHNETTEVTDLSSVTTKSEESAFKDFVNKLGHICDSERGGTTVTAFAVLRMRKSKLQYRFASNQLAQEYLEKARLYITSVLNLLGQTATESLRTIDSHILRMTLDYCSSRVAVYVGRVESELVHCIQQCESSEMGQGPSLTEKLVELQTLAHNINQNAIEDAYPAFSQDCERLIRALELLYKSDHAILIEFNRTENEMSDKLHWCGFHHAAGRLRAYLHAVPIFISVRRCWPKLFQNFEVVYVSSSKPDPNPLQTGSRRGGLYADEIIGRMTSNKTMLAMYKSHAEALQQYELDERIQAQSINKRFKPIVHAEALLLDSLINDQLADHASFFGNWPYIGCSKPTCRLCCYFFAAHPSGVQVRPTHRNIYPNWKTPDVYSDRGSKATKERERIINTMLVSIREDAFRLLVDKQPERRIHDSNDDPTVAILSVSSVAPIDDDDDSVSTMGLTSFDTREATASTLAVTNEVAFSDLVFESADEEEGGGAQI